MFVTRNVAQKYMAPAGDDGGDGGGGGGGAGGADDNVDPPKPDDKPADPPKPDDNAEPNKGGARKVSDEEARLLKENMKKKEALDRATAELKKAQESLKRYDGIDPEAVKKLLAEQKTAEEKQLEAKGEWDRLKARMAEEHGKEINTLQQQIQQLSEQLNSTQSTIKDLSVGTQFSQSKFIAEELTLTPAKARVIYGEYFDVEDGKVVGYDKPRGSANRTAIVDQYGNSVGFEDALRKIIDADPEKDHLLKSKMKPGAGSDSKKPAGTTKTEVPVDGISRIAAGLKGIKLA